MSDANELYNYVAARMNEFDCEQIDGVQMHRLIQGAINQTMRRAIAQARKDALEDAAKVADETHCAAINDSWLACQRAIAKSIRALQMKADGGTEGTTKPGGRDLGGGTFTFPGEPKCAKHAGPCGFDAMDSTPTCVWCGYKGKVSRNGL